MKEAASSSKSDEEQTKNTSSSGSWRSRFPDWAQEGLTLRSGKLLIRSWVVAWVSFLLLLIGPSLRALGQAAFFASIVVFILPASMPTVLFLMAALMLVAGACFGWAWSLAALASGVRARSQALSMQATERVQRGAAQSTNPDLYYQTQVFQGAFLDTNSSAVVGVYFVLGCYAMGWLQAARPQLKIFALFATILMDINLAYGPLFPNVTFTFGKILLYPTGCAVGIGVAAQILIFPESFSYSWQLNMIKLLNLNKKLLAVQADALRQIVSDPQKSNEIEAKLTPVVRKIQGGLLALYNAVGAQAHFLHLDISFSRFTPRDLKRIFTSIQTSTIRLLGLDAFMHLFAQTYTDDNSQEKADGTQVTLAETHVALQVRENLTFHEEQQNVPIGTLLKLLGDATERPLRAADESLATMSGWLDAVANHGGRYDHDAWLTKLETTHEALCDALDAFMKTDRITLIKPYEHLFVQDAHGKTSLSGEARDKFRNSSRPLYVCFVFAANLSIYLAGLKDTQRELVELARHRPKRRLRVPSMGLKRLWKLLNHKPSVGTALPEQESPVLEDRYPSQSSSEQEETYDDDQSHDSELHSNDLEKGAGQKKSQERISSDRAEEEKRRKADANSKAGPRNPDALPPTNIFHHVGRGLSASYAAFWSPEGVYALRYAIVSFALWIPSVLPSSAFFVYEHRSIWALIMSQTLLAISSGQLMFSLILRLLGTAAGLVLGMLLWYISCGNAERGNVYGLGAVSAIAFIPLMWLRLYSPPFLLMGVILMTVTVALVIGYSWIDTHIFQLANNGKGVDVAWRRALLVLIGSAAGLIVSIFPRPASTKRNVRKGFASNTRQIAQLYTTILERWIAVETEDEAKGIFNDEDMDVPATDKEEISTYERNRRKALLKAVKPSFLRSQALLGMLQQDISISSLDISFSGPWPKERYLELLDVHSRLLQAIAQMISSSLGLHDIVWRKKILYTTATLDPLTISDSCVTLSLLASALQTGTPLPHAFTPILETTLHHQQMTRGIERVISKQTGSLDVDTITFDMLCDPQFMSYSSHVLAHITFVRQIDRLRAIVSELVGEQALAGFDSIKARFDRRYVEATHHA